jgi:TM2 domain-containing membrane protein YozV
MNADDRDEWLKVLSKTAGESDKNWTVAFCLSLFFGYFGIDRFYLNSMGLGFLKMVTFGGAGLWWIIDILLLLCGKMRDAEGGLVTRPF